MIDGAFNITYPTTFQVLPDWNIAANVPEQTNVLCLGEEHKSILHNIWLYYNLPSLAEQGYKTLAIEAPVYHQEILDYSLKNLKYDPENIGSLYFPDGHTSNHFGFVNSPVCKYKTLKRAQELGMDVVCVDHENAWKACDSADYTERNKYMAKQILPLAQKGKTIFWGGRAHVYSTNSALDDYSCETSIQELLQRNNVSTYTIGMISLGSDILKDYRWIKKTDFSGAENLYQDFMNNLRESNENISIQMDLKKYSELAGISMPDELVLFSEKSSYWCYGTQKLWQEQFSKSTDERGIVEDAIWSVIEKAHPSPVL